jgi:outer membrane protein assembly factor BamB
VRRWRPRAVPIATALLLALGVVAATRRPSPAVRPTAPPGLPPATYSPRHLPPPWPGPLPYPILIADEGNARLLEVAPTGRILWAYPTRGSKPSPFGVPGDDAFFTPDGRGIVTNDEDAGTILLISYYQKVVTWHFGVRGVLGGGPHLLDYPDDAYRLPDGDTVVADIRNCRELFLAPSGAVVRQLGRPQTGYCITDPAHGLYGYPNGDTPQPNGDLLMSFISGNEIALVTPTGHVVWQAEAPDLYGGYVSDAQLLPDGDVLVAGYGDPGTLVVFDPRTGRVLWRYLVASGPGALDHPSIALPLPNGDVLATDDGHDRVVVIDPRTNRIVWQYGHLGVPGTAPGYLRLPDGVDVDAYRNWLGWLRARGAPA